MSSGVKPRRTTSSAAAKADRRTHTHCVVSIQRQTPGRTITGRRLCHRNEPKVMPCSDNAGALEIHSVELRLGRKWHAKPTATRLCFTTAPGSGKRGTRGQRQTAPSVRKSRWLNTTPCDNEWEEEGAWETRPSCYTYITKRTHGVHVVKQISKSLKNLTIVF